jgi:hypothetical protein
MIRLLDQQARLVPHFFEGGEPVAHRVLEKRGETAGDAEHAQLAAVKSAMRAALGRSMHPAR